MTTAQRPSPVIIDARPDGSYTIVTENGASLVPTQRAPLVPYTQPQPRYSLRDDIIDSLTDGRAIIYSGLGLCLGLAGITTYLFIENLLDAIHIASEIAAGVLTLVAICIIAGWVTRTKEPDTLFLKGCPTRSPGVHQVKLCNGRH